MKHKLNSLEPELRLKQKDANKKLIDCIRKQTDLLEVKLDNTENDVVRDCAITDFVNPLIRRLNNTTTFNLRLEIDDKAEVDKFE